MVAAEQHSGKYQCTNVGCTRQNEVCGFGYLWSHLPISATVIEARVCCMVKKWRVSGAMGTGTQGRAHAVLSSQLELGLCWLRSSCTEMPSPRVSEIFIPRGGLFVVHYTVHCSETLCVPAKGRFYHSTQDKILNNNTRPTNESKGLLKVHVLRSPLATRSNTLQVTHPNPSLTQSR